MSALSPVRRAFIRKQSRVALVALPVGLAFVLVGSILAVRSDWLPGILLGSVGVALLCWGALSGRRALAGPFPPESGGSA